jgi:hypothetical protein
MNQKYPYLYLTHFLSFYLAVSVHPKNVFAALQLEYPQVPWDQLFKDSAYALKPKSKKKNRTSSGVDAEKFRAEYKVHFDSVAEKLGIVTLEDWYKHSKEDLLRQSPEIRKATKLLRGGLSKSLSIIYPDHEWHSWKLEKVSARFWDSRENRRKFFTSIVPENQLDLWYSESFSAEDVKRKFSGAPSILKLFRGSLAGALRDAFPDHEWMEWKFVRAPHRFWNDPKTRKRFFDTFGAHHHIGETEVDPWYAVSMKQIASFGGASLLRRIYSNSLYQALIDVYPEKKFKIWKFLNPHQQWWNDVEHAKAFLAPIIAQKGINQPEDWYNISEKEIESLGGGRISLLHLLTTTFPGHQWDPSLFKQRTKTQRN